MASQKHEDPIHISPTTITNNPAAFILLHGLGDDATPFESIAQQFQSANKLPHMHWILPTALENRDLMQRAWYMPSPLTPFPSSRPELDDPEDEEGLLKSREYVEELIQDLVEQKGVPVERIVLGGFSQGCALSLLTALTSSQYADELAGVVALAGYLPLADRIGAMRQEAGLSEHVGDGGMPVFLQRGNRDMLVPKRYLRICREKIQELGFEEAKITVREYEGLGHALSAGVLRDLCAWLEEVVPAVE